jgi:hypothetical protein
MSNALFDDLVALEKTSFPKKCETCGTTYHSEEEFLKLTEDINGRSGLKSSEDDDGSSILEVFRNCPCGSTLLDFFSDRRDMSANGEKRRKAFSTVLEHLVEQGIDVEIARTELKYYLKHKKSELLDKLGVFKRRAKKRNDAG